MQPRRVEVWSEKGTVRGTLAPVLDEYGVTFRVMHGYGSATTVYGAAQESLSNDKPMCVLYVGDWDPSGMQMSEVDLPDRLQRYGGRCELARVALNAADVASGIPSFDADSKSGDPRHRWFTTRYGSRCWELDALSPVILRQRVANTIRNLLDLDAWEHAVKVERAERESMQNILGTWQATISGPASKSPGGRA